MPNLPPTIPRASSSPSSFPGRPAASSIGRAQQINIGTLQQEKDRQAATTSIAGAIARKDGQHNNAPTSSINRVGGSAAPSTSIFHPGTAPDSMADESDAVRDRLRFQFIRKMMREKQEAADIAEQAASQQGGLDINTGKSMRTTGVNSLKKTLTRMYRANRSEFKAMTVDDKALLQKIIQDKAQSKLTGSRYTFRDKRKMSEQVYKNYKEGNITKEKYRHFKSVIDDLT